MQKRFRLASEERGSALVEFAVTVPLVTFLLFTVLQGMFAMYTYLYTAYAAQQGARFAEVRGYTWSQNTPTPCSTSATNYDCTATSSDIQNYARSLGVINTSNLTVNTSWPGINPDGTTTGCTTEATSKGCLVKVTASYTLDVIPFLPFTALRMSASSEKVILQ